MLFKSFTILALTLNVLAAPATEAVDDLVVIDSQKFGDGMIITYGDKPGALTSRAVAAPIPGCGNPSVECSSGHTANASTCRDLINSLAGSGTPVGESPRAVCVQQGGNQCCVSWSKAVGTFEKRELHDAAQTTLDRCTRDRVSGLQRNTVIKGTCMTQCLSDRPNGCS